MTTPPRLSTGLLLPNRSAADVAFKTVPGHHDFDGRSVALPFDDFVRRAATFPKPSEARRDRAARSHSGIAKDEPPEADRPEAGKRASSVADDTQPGAPVDAAAAACVAPFRLDTPPVAPRTADSLAPGSREASPSQEAREDAVDGLANADLRSLRLGQGPWTVVEAPPIGTPSATLDDPSEALAAIGGTDENSETLTVGDRGEPAPIAGQGIELDPISPFAPGSSVEGGASSGEMVVVEVPNPAEAVRLSETASPQVTGGMAGAQSGEGMRTARRPNKSAENGEHKLPAGMNSAVSQAESAVGEQPGTSRNPLGATDTAAAESQSGLAAATSKAVLGDAKAGTFSGADAPDGAQERIRRIESLISREIAGAHRAGAQSMTVVLRPDAGTELLVKFSQRAGQCEVTVRCDRGDFSGLSNDWQQLRQSLAGHQVRLLPLTEAGRGTADASLPSGQRHHSSSGDQTPQRHQPLPEPAVEPRRRTITIVASDATRPSDPTGPEFARRGSWESWA